jgi:hypothetical protein
VWRIWGIGMKGRGRRKRTVKTGGENRRKRQKK